jgi:hypothetical protein
LNPTILHTLPVYLTIVQFKPAQQVLAFESNSTGIGSLDD